MDAHAVGLAAHRLEGLEESRRVAAVLADGGCRVECTAREQPEAMLRTARFSATL